MSAPETVTVPRSLLLAAWAVCHAEDLPVAALLAAYLWETTPNRRSDI